MAKRPQPAPDAIYTCDRFRNHAFGEVRLYRNRLETDITTHLPASVQEDGCVPSVRLAGCDDQEAQRHMEA